MTKNAKFCSCRSRASMLRRPMIEQCRVAAIGHVAPMRHYCITMQHAQVPWQQGNMAAIAG
ncbi:hypothetical protein GUY61_10375 [Streptomyces sp. GC420]|nr:hypothetical protein [Streptomyces sp. GC420]